MKVLIGGVIAAVLGLIGLVIWWKPFLDLLAGGIPIILLLGGALAIYVGYDEIMDQIKSKEEETASTVDLDAAKEELQKAKAEAEKYKAELEKTKAPKKK
ncbi:MAG: hypothetical protein JRC53_00875 [Deltaproteobacteria bacterium]|nr:hypothetical protein [Deltaproteobacteria bacterium]MBW2648363.1 hypothetical protein [Deltaproteobacteria bacterium]